MAEQPGSEPGSPDAGRPNIVFVFVDNLGYGELGCYGGGEVRGVPTPNIDRLAAEGMRLTNMNMEAQCTPSRSAVPERPATVPGRVEVVPLRPAEGSSRHRLGNI